MWRRVTAADRRLIKRIVRLPLRSKLGLAVSMYRDRRIPAGLRLIPPALVLYLAMPVDIVPDFIPVLGQLDDIFIVVLGVWLLFRFAGRSVIEELVTLSEEALHDRGVNERALPETR
jgi:uncharacterized membrane protein YkvA (DUF1232 family)